jgi:ClpP class serine protease
MRRRFDRPGNLVLDPKAFLMFFEEPEEPVNEELAGGEIEVVSVCGPLVHHEGGWFDSYGAIVSRVESACAGKASTIVLRVDSPGGDLNGCFDASRAIRERCATAGKRLVAHVEGQACSGGYALASAAQEVVIGDTAVIGSIGVLNTRLDLSAADAAYGNRFALTMSGKRKADGHPHARLTDDELEATQTLINSLAGVFFQLVSEHRGVDVEAVQSLEAGLFHGVSAISAGLADRVQSFDALIASLAAGEGATDMATKVETPAVAPTVGNIDDARAALEKAAEGEGEDAEKAKRALKALDAEPEEEDDDSVKSGDDDEDDDKTSARARGGNTVASSTAAELATNVNTLAKRVVKLEREKEDVERREFLASRPDLNAELVTVLQSKPLAEVRAIVNAVPKPETPNHAAGAVVQSTRGEGQTSPNDGRVVASPEFAWMDRMMGLAPEVGGVSREVGSLVFRIGDTDKPAANAAAEGTAK